ncbi:unnamed protein product [Urochloa humidicola]
MAATQGAGGGGRHKFFKVLLPGSFELRLIKFPWRAAKLRDGAGRSWDVDLNRDGDDRRVSLTGSGWRAFVSANGISAGQLLVFKHHRGGCLDPDGDHFAVDIFDASGCCCLTTSDTTINMDDDGGIKRRKLLPPSSTNTTTTGNELCRRIDMPYPLRFLEVSKSFCERLGCTSSRDVQLIVIRTAAGDNNHRRIWPVSVKVSAKSGMMCAGWTEFAQDNGLAISDACVFLPLDVQGTALQVRVIRGTTGPRSLEAPPPPDECSAKRHP